MAQKAKMKEYEENKYEGKKLINFSNKKTKNKKQNKNKKQKKQKTKKQKTKNTKTQKKKDARISRTFHVKDHKSRRICFCSLFQK